MSTQTVTATGAAPAARAKKTQNLWNNHPFYYHIAALFVPAQLGILIGLWFYTRHEMQALAAMPAEQLATGVRLAGQSLSMGVLLAMLLSLPLAWWLARRIASRLDILKEQAAVIRVLDFNTDIPLDTPIREIFGLGRAMRQMKGTIQKFMRVSLALSGERDFAKLLGKVLHEMREALDGDGGVIYLHDEGQNQLKQSSQRWTKEGGAQPNAWQDMPLSDATHPVAAAFKNQNATSVFTIGFPRPTGLEFLDERYGKRPVQLVAIPLRSSDSSLVGIVCNFMAPGKAAPSSDRMALAEAFSSSAAVAIDQQRLLEAQKALMDSMIKIMAGAIDAKSPYTGGHCERVPELGMMLAEEACQVKEGTLADFAFKTDDEWREFRIGAWLHDCGKVTTPEYVVDKATKLETIYNRIHDVRARFEVLLRDAKITQLEAVANGADPQQAQASFDARQAALSDDFAFIAECNMGGEFMAPEKLERLKSIATETWQRHFDDRIGLSHDELKRHTGEPAPLPATERLIDDKPHHVIARTDTRVLDPKWGFKVNVPEHLYNYGELYNLSVGRGTLTEEERFKINEHVIHSLMMLEQLPLPKNLKRVPEYAGTHHETLTGSGYPRKLTAAELSVPMRIMAIADIFEALTACDRPYKKAKTLSESIKILSFFKKDGHIDPVLFDLLLTSGVYKRYAEKYLLPEQIDEVDISRFISQP
ncbi:MAG: GAF domain-containing protein [Rhodoferax sp.]|nr:GAF domain-containing protein [Rhodoferax sp.]